MKFIIFICFVFISIYAFTFTDSAATKVQCFDKNTNHHWDAGTEYRPVGQCAKIQCKADGSKAALTCPLSQGGSGCTKVDGNLRKTYPDCCPTFNCKRN